MWWRIMASACLLGAVAVSQPAAAQSPTLRGPWLGGGLGTASAQVNCELCTSDRNGGLSGYLTGGITLSPTVRLGAELAGWFDTTDDVSQRLVHYGATAYWTPVPTGAWYLKGGLGLLSYHAGTPAEDDVPLGASAAALHDGWLHTGDVGRCESDGGLLVLGRRARAEPDRAEAATLVERARPLVPLVREEFEPLLRERLRLVEDLARRDRVRRPDEHPGGAHERQAERGGHQRHAHWRHAPPGNAELFSGGGGTQHADRLRSGPVEVKWNVGVCARSLAVLDSPGSAA